MERLIHKDRVHSRIGDKENRESDEGVSQAPDWPFPGKTAKSASPIASPGQGLSLPLHVADHRGDADRDCTFVFNSLIW